MPYEYSTERYKEVIDFLNTLPKNISILDVGCGTGNILEYIYKETGISTLTGIDVDKESIRVAREKGLKVLEGSILDDEFLKNINDKYNVVIFGAILHHLIGNSRRESFCLAKKAIQNGNLLLRQNGFIIILEPTFLPGFLMTIIFYIKKFLSFFTQERVTIFNRWNNLGPPIVSYFTPRQLIQMLLDFDMLKVIRVSQNKSKLNLLPKMFAIKKFEVLVICNKINCLGG